MSTSREDGEASATALNEGEKLGKRLHNLWTAALEELGSQGVAWQSADDVHHAAMVRTARRFRDESVTAYEWLVKVARAVDRSAEYHAADHAGVDGASWSIPHRLYNELEMALFAFSVSAPDEPPKPCPSEEESSCPIDPVGPIPEPKPRQKVAEERETLKGDMSEQIVSYRHHGWKVHVREDLEGRHREFCLCHRCAKLNLEDQSQNCKIASLLYALDVAFDLVTPVWECPEFDTLPE